MKRENGTGSIIRCKGLRKPYKVMSPMHEGKKPSFLGYYATIKEAEKALSDHSLPLSVTRFAQVYEEWIRFRSHRLSDSRLTALSCAFAHCSPLHDRHISDVVLSDILEVFEANRGRGKKTVDDIRTVICGVFGYAYRNEMIQRDPAALLTSDDLLWTDRQKRDVKILSPEQTERVIRSPRSEFADILVMTLYTGLRLRSELLTLTPDNVHTEGGLHLICGAKTEAGRDRTIPIHPDIVPLVEEYVSKAADGEPLFGMSYDRIWADMKRQYSGHTPHHLRHTFRSRLDSLGANHRCAELLMGHSVRTVSDIYIHKTFDELAAAVALLDFGYIYRPLIQN
ncbi:MAG: tyrosine-type recombinase/integrase [Oscillospiraceae bacterium]|nr:tyrosine-type recombinase/integrase [Oscillospiraceae bacterium]